MTFLNLGLFDDVPRARAKPFSIVAPRIESGAADGIPQLGHLGLLEFIKALIVFPLKFYGFLQLIRGVAAVDALAARAESLKAVGSNGARDVAVEIFEDTARVGHVWGEKSGEHSVDEARVGHKQRPPGTVTRQVYLFDMS